MKRTVSKIFRRLMVLVTIAVFIPYLSTVLLPYIDTATYWYVSIIGLGFIILFFLLLALLVFWLAIRSRMWIACLIVMLIGFQQIRVAFGFNLFHSFQLENPPGTIRVMQWNVHNWNQIKFERERAFDMNAWPKMMDLIRKYDADVLCLEEFFQSEDRKKLPSNIATLQKMGYKYYFFLHGDKRDNVYYEGNAIFSKFPIVESGEVKVDHVGDAQPLAYADVLAGDRRIRMVAIHLQSVEFHSEQYENLSKIKRAERPGMEESRTILSKLKLGFQRRYGQAVSVNQQIEQSPYPLIVCGDFNDVPNSGTYFTITKNLQDAFLKKGFFIGRTFRFISPTLRIDYILPDKQFKVKQFKKINAPYSDHYPLVADIEV